MKKCCEHCFTNMHIQEHIRALNQVGTCDFCRETNVHLIPSREMGIYLRDRIAAFYEPFESLTPSFNFGNQLSNYSLLGILRFDERALSKTALGEDDPHRWLDHGTYDGAAFVNELLDASSGHPSPQADQFAKKKAFTEFIIKSETGHQAKDKFTLAWEKFRQEARHFARFFDMQGHGRRAPLDELAPWLNQLSRELPVGSVLWRCRILSEFASTDKDDVAFKIGPAPLHVVKNNRMSPAGISYTYLAEDDETAIAEIRPNVGDHVWSCSFATKKALRVVDLSDVRAFKAPSIFDPTFTPDMKRVPDFLKAFADEISQPVSAEASIIEYVPSQMVCEYIRSLGYDGVCFRSSLFGYKGLGWGLPVIKKNYVLFCGPPPDPTYSLALPDFREWLDLKSWIGKTVVGVKYDTHMSTGAHGGGNYRMYSAGP